MRCDRCAEEPPDTWREGLAVCDSCARRLDARAAVRLEWAVRAREAMRQDQWEDDARLTH